jgi:hypothetical protein
MRRMLVIASLVTMYAVTFASSAQASTPIHFSFTSPNVFTDTDTCVFPIAVNLQVNLVGTVFLDSQGNPESAIFEQNVVGTDTANGVTLRDATHYVDHFDALGGDRQVGLVFHVQFEGGGVVLRDAGLLDINPDGSIALVRGPHPFTEGDTTAFCAAFG